MNRTPIAKNESNGNHRYAQFMAVYPLARRAAEVRTATIVCQVEDREDLVQEALAAVWHALQFFDPSRASLRTFVERIVANRVASLMRTRRRQPVFEVLQEHHLLGLDGIPTAEFRIDFQKVAASLSEPDRRFAESLLEHRPTEACRAMGISRSCAYERIRRIRTALENAGFRTNAGHKK